MLDVGTRLGPDTIFARLGAGCSISRGMAVAVKGEATFKTGVPQARFEARAAEMVNLNQYNYAATGDGQRFLIDTPARRGRLSDLTRKNQFAYRR